jgi:hypothetical protein
LKIHFLDLAQVAFWAGQKAENECAGQVDTFKHRFLDLVQVAFLDVQKGKDYCAWTSEALNHRFLDLVQVAIWADLEVENECAGPVFKERSVLYFFLVYLLMFIFCILAI